MFIFFFFYFYVFWLFKLFVIRTTFQKSWTRGIQITEVLLQYTYYKQNRIYVKLHGIYINAFYTKILIKEQRKRLTRVQYEKNFKYGYNTSIFEKKYEYLVTLENTLPNLQYKQFSLHCILTNIKNAQNRILGKPTDFTNMAEDRFPIEGTDFQFVCLNLAESQLGQLYQDKQQYTSNTYVPTIYKNINTFNHQKEQLKFIKSY
eukprot:TRINITY_DN6526_c0_g2_i1.p2 TRINITY_DN6526_c0_g2~~TRINITY_DN6526_c0_g2_i1.p2  ORF type:complete len:204 (-),score=-10.55 TRINITY_DN6526_c0_g2_i1:253-864(-)